MLLRCQGAKPRGTDGCRVRGMLSQPKHHNVLVYGCVVVCVGVCVCVFVRDGGSACSTVETHRIAGGYEQLAKGLPLIQAFLLSLEGATKTKPELNDLISSNTASLN